MNETALLPDSPESPDSLTLASTAARHMLGDTVEAQQSPGKSEVSPEDRLAEGLSKKLYNQAVNLGERRLPLGTQPPYVERPYYELPEQRQYGDLYQRTLNTRSLSFDPAVRGVAYTASSVNMSRATTLRTTTGTPPGSFRAETDVEDRVTYRIGLDYIAPDPDTQTPGQILFFDSRFMDTSQTHLAHDDPRRQNVLNQLLSDINSTEQAVAEFEAIEGLGA